MHYNNSSRWPLRNNEFSDTDKIKWSELAQSSQVFRSQDYHQSAMLIERQEISDRPKAGQAATTTLAIPFCNEKMIPDQAFNSLPDYCVSPPFLYRSFAVIFDYLSNTIHLRTEMHNLGRECTELLYIWNHPIHPYQKSSGLWNIIGGLHERLSYQGRFLPHP